MEILIAQAKQATRKHLHCRIQHIRKEGNSVAHSLAKPGLLLEDDAYWVEESSKSVVALVADDCPRL